MICKYTRSFQGIGFGRDVEPVIFHKYDGFATSSNPSPEECRMSLGAEKSRFRAGTGMNGASLMYNWSCTGIRRISGTCFPGLLVLNSARPASANSRIEGSGLIRMWEVSFLEISAATAGAEQRGAMRKAGIPARIIPRTVVI